MAPFTLDTKLAMALFVAGILAVGPAMADKPSWAGSDKGGKKDHGDQRDEGGGRHFQERQHMVVREYYSKQYSGGRCPPGLAKKHNGCMPPGQARKWQVGQPLPREVVYYPVPKQLVVEIGPPPSGHQYVRVAGDILMIAIGTGMVVDAIQDLGRK